MSEPYLIADIGATNARFALLADLHEGKITSQCNLPANDFANLTEAVQAYLSLFSNPKITGACIAIAGPVHKPIFTLANNHWQVCKAELEDMLDCHVLWINDFEAQAWGVTDLATNQQHIVKSGTAKLDGNRLIVGPGSGLGVAGLVVNCGCWVPVIGEGGHASFAPMNQREIDVLSYLLKKYEHVSVERVASGSGIPVLYEALAELSGSVAKYKQAVDVVNAAKQGCKLAEETVQMFFSILGQAVGSSALVMGATGGVFLVGGILPKLQEQLENSEFVSRFTRRERFRSYLEDIPIILSIDPDLGLKGAAIALATRRNNV